MVSVANRSRFYKLRVDGCALVIYYVNRKQQSLVVVVLVVVQHATVWFATEIGKLDNTLPSLA